MANSTFHINDVCLVSKINIRGYWGIYKLYAYLKKVKMNSLLTIADISPDRLEFTQLRQQTCHHKFTESEALAGLSTFAHESCHTTSWKNTSLLLKSYLHRIKHRLPTAPFANRHIINITPLQQLPHIHRVGPQELYTDPVAVAELLAHWSNHMAAEQTTVLGPR